jgi:hypothetical protein
MKITDARVLLAGYSDRRRGAAFGRQGFLENITGELCAEVFSAAGWNTNIARHFAAWKV